MKFELDKELREPEYDVILTLLKISPYEKNIHKEDFQKIINAGWWSAPSIDKTNIFKLGRSNIPEYTNRLIKEHLIQKKEVPYRDNRKRHKHRVMYRLNPRSKGKIYSIISQKQFNEFFKKKIITTKYAPMVIMNTPFFKNGKEIHKWMPKAVDEEIEKLEELKMSIDIMINLKKTQKELYFSIIKSKGNKTKQEENKNKKK